MGQFLTRILRSTIQTWIIPLIRVNEPAVQRVYASEGSHNPRDQSCARSITPLVECLSCQQRKEFDDLIFVLEELPKRSQNIRFVYHQEQRTAWPS